MIKHRLCRLKNNSSLCYKVLSMSAYHWAPLSKIGTQEEVFVAVQHMNARTSYLIPTEEFHKNWKILDEEDYPPAYRDKQ